MQQHIRIKLAEGPDLAGDLAKTIQEHAIRGSLNLEFELPTDKFKAVLLLKTTISAEEYIFEITIAKSDFSSLSLDDHKHLASEYWRKYSVSQDEAIYRNESLSENGIRRSTFAISRIFPTLGVKCDFKND
jgi:hypothetical protein